MICAIKTTDAAEQGASAPWRRAPIFQGARFVVFMLASGRYSAGLLALAFLTSANIPLRL
jgi:hypothetical protein